MNLKHIIGQNNKKMIMHLLIFVFSILIVGCSSNSNTIPENITSANLDTSQNVDVDKTLEIEDPQVNKLYETANSIGNSSGNISNSGIATTQDDWIFYVSSVGEQKGIYKEKYDGSEKSRITPEDIKDPYSLNVVGDWLYFIENKSTSSLGGSSWISSTDQKMYKIKTDGSELTKLSNDDIREIVVTDKEIFFNNISDNNRIYKMDLNGFNSTSISDGKTMELVLYNNDIYYVDFSDQDNMNICKITTDGNDWKMIISEPNTNWIKNVIIYDDTVYYIYDDNDYNSSLKTSDLDGNNKKTIIHDVSAFNIIDDKVYAYTYEEGVFKYNIDGSGKEKLTIDSTYSINLISDLIFYESEVLIKMKNDGSSRVRLVQ
ncbi:DUF5050 domain-containing protein [Acetoanaerobium sticklandii]|uniref:DUF5050 domain-containing protein n=1 Tax=Acetoanaerobium sticklandii TaxID=1511 RepID=UPI003A91DE7C